MTKLSPWLGADKCFCRFGLVLNAQCSVLTGCAQLRVSKEYKGSVDLALIPCLSLGLLLGIV